MRVQYIISLPSHRMRRLHVGQEMVRNDRVFPCLLASKQESGLLYYYTTEATSSRSEPSNFHTVYTVASVAQLHLASAASQSLGTWHLQYFQKQTVCIPFLRLKMFLYRMNVVILKIISIFISFLYAERE